MAILAAGLHNGWAELLVIDPFHRARLDLVDPNLPQNPYHHEGLRLPLPETEALVARVRASLEARAHAALAALPAVHAIALEASPYPSLPASVAEVLASWPLTCAADGMLYREGFAAVAAARGLRVHRFPRRLDVLRWAADARGEPPEAITAHLLRLGRAAGPPWQKEHRTLAAVALALAAAEGR